MSSSFGKILTLTTFGESHGVAVGGIIDGFPANIEIDFDFINSEIAKRSPGTSEISSKRKEPDKIIFLSGIFKNKSLGTPIAFYTLNKDAKSTDYDEIKNIFRPGHADFTYQKKYGIRNYRGGGRASARETFARVVAGAFAKILLNKLNISIFAYTSKIGNIKIDKEYNSLILSNIYNYKTNCPDTEYDKKFTEEIKKHQKNGDSIGGIITCVIKNCPIGLGEPVFDKFHAKLGQAILSINACKGFEIGAGFKSAELTGSENNDEFFTENNIIKTKSNNAGGVLGGITNGEDIYFNAVFKPTPTIFKAQNTIDKDNNNITIKNKGRHDPCVVPRATVIVEAMTALTIADFLLQNNAKNLL